MTHTTTLSPTPPRIHVTGLAVDPVDRDGLFDYLVTAALAGRGVT